MTNKYWSNPHLQGTNEGNKNKVEESQLIRFVAFNQTLGKGFDYSGEEHTGPLLLIGHRLLGSHGCIGTGIFALPPSAAERETEAPLKWSPGQSRGCPAPEV